MAIGALENAVGGADYDDADGWGTIAARAKAANVEVDPDMFCGEIICDISDQESGQQRPPLGAKSAVKKSLFITDTVMGQNSYEFTAGVDTFNGTPMYCGFNTFKACGGEKLLELELNVSHVGGGGLKIHGLWADVLLMNHGHPFVTDIVVGDFSVKSAEALLGMPTLSTVLKASVDCVLGICHMVDSDGENWVFGKNRLKAPRTELDALCADFGARRKARETPVAAIAKSKSVKVTRRSSKPEPSNRSDDERCLAARDAAALLQIYHYYLGKAGECALRIQHLIMELDSLERDVRLYAGKLEPQTETRSGRIYLEHLPDGVRLLAWFNTNELDWLPVDATAPRAFPSWNASLYKEVRALSTGKPHKRLLSMESKARELIDEYIAKLVAAWKAKTNCERASLVDFQSGGARSTTTKISCEVGASETLADVVRQADGQDRPAAADPTSPEGEALRSYVRWLGLNQPIQKTFAREWGCDEARKCGDESNFYSKNGFLTFVRESLKEASTTGIRPKVEEWYGVRKVPWLQLALQARDGNHMQKEYAKQRFGDAFDGSDLSSYDATRKSGKIVSFDETVSHKELTALPVRTEDDLPPSDLNESVDLLDKAPPVTESEMETILGHIGAEFDEEHGMMTGDPASIAELELRDFRPEDVERQFNDWENGQSVGSTIIDDSEEFLKLTSCSNERRRVAIPIGLVLGGVTAELVECEIDGKLTTCIRGDCHDVKALRQSIQQLDCLELGAISDNVKERLTKEQADAMLAKYSSDLFNQVPHVTQGHADRVGKTLEEALFGEFCELAAHEGVNKKIFVINDGPWDIAHRCEIKFNEGITQYPKVDYRRQPVHLLHIAVRMFSVLLKCKFYDRGQTGYSIPAILIPKAGAERRTGLNPDGTVGEFRVVGDSKVPNSITQDVSYPTAHLDDTMMAVNEMAVEAYRQERCRKAKIENSLDEDRFEKPLLDNKSPAEGFISGHDLTKCFHRQGLKEGLSRDVCSLNYRGLGTLRALRCSQGPKQIPASWARFCADILARTGMIYGEGLEEAIDPKDEADLKKFIGDQTGDYTSTPPHSFMRCYVDDLVTMSVSRDQTWRQCLTLIFWFKRLQLFINPLKSKVHCESIRFLGYCVGYNLQFADPERCRAIALIPEPITVKEVRRFIGGTGFFSNTVADYSLLCAPLHRCTKNDVPEKDVTVHWFIDLKVGHEKFETHWIRRVMSGRSSFFFCAQLQPVHNMEGLRARRGGRASFLAACFVGV